MNLIIATVECAIIVTGLYVAIVAALCRLDERKDALEDEL